MPRSAKAEAKRTRILEAARALFARQGFADTSLEDIGRESRMGKATLYYYFPDGKESIFAAAVQVRVGALFEKLTEEMGKGANPRERMRIYLTHRVLLFHDQALQYGMAEEVRQELMLRAEQELRGIFEQELQLLEHLVVDAASQGDFVEVDPPVAARILQAAMKGVTSDAPLPESAEQVARDAEIFVGMMLDGLARQEP